MVRHTCNEDETVTHLYIDFKILFVSILLKLFKYMHLLDFTFPFVLFLCIVGVESGKPTHFTVLTKGAGKAPLDVTFSSPVEDFDIIDNYDYSHTVKYTPAQQVCQMCLSVYKCL